MIAAERERRRSPARRELGVCRVVDAGRHSNRHGKDGDMSRLGTRKVSLLNECAGDSAVQTALPVFSHIHRPCIHTDAAPPPVLSFFAAGRAWVDPPPGREEGGLGQLGRGEVRAGGTGRRGSLSGLERRGGRKSALGGLGRLGRHGEGREAWGPGYATRGVVERVRVLCCAGETFRGPVATQTLTRMASDAEAKSRR